MTALAAPPPRPPLMQQQQQQSANPACGVVGNGGGRHGGARHSTPPPLPHHQHRRNSSDGGASTATTSSPLPSPAVSVGHAPSPQHGTPGSPRAGGVGLQTQLRAAHERIAALETALRARAADAAAADAFRRRAAELEALYALSSSELARAREAAVAAAAAAAAHAEAQQRRIAALETRLAALSTPGGARPAGSNSGSGSASPDALVPGRGRDAATAAAAGGSPFDAGAPPPPPQHIAGPGALGALDRGGSVPEPLPPAGLSGFARDAQVWGLRGAGSGGVPPPPPPPHPSGGHGHGHGGEAGGGWGARTFGAGPGQQALPPLLPAASAPATWEPLSLSARHAPPSSAAPPPPAGALDAPPHHQHHPHQQQHHHNNQQQQAESPYDVAERAHLVGLLPFDLDTLGADAPRDAPPRAHSASAKSAKARLPSWADAWAAGGGRDAEASGGADQSASVALKRTASMPGARGAGLGHHRRMGSAGSGSGGGADAPPHGAGADVNAADDAAAQNRRLRAKTGAAPSPCVYVAFLGWWVTEKELEALFAPHGALVSVRLLISKKSRRSREQAFVEFAAPGAAAAAIAALDGLDAPALVKQPGCGGLVVRFADRRRDDE